MGSAAEARLGGPGRLGGAARKTKSAGHVGFLVRSGRLLSLADRAASAGGDDPASQGGGMGEGHVRSVPLGRERSQPGTGELRRRSGDTGRDLSGRRWTIWSPRPRRQRLGMVLGYFWGRK